jgi:hypothetical protein
MGPPPPRGKKRMRSPDDDDDDDVKDVWALAMSVDMDIDHCEGLSRGQQHLLSTNSGI